MASLSCPSEGETQLENSGNQEISLCVSVVPSQFVPLMSTDAEVWRLTFLSRVNWRFIYLFGLHSPQVMTGCLKMVQTYDRGREGGRKDGWIQTGREEGRNLSWHLGEPSLEDRRWTYLQDVAP